eukprot:scaffold817_cov246-Pinguiococcus_pyrenoidosus.AAC.6
MRHPIGPAEARSDVVLQPGIKLLKGVSDAMTQRHPVLAPSHACEIVDRFFIPRICLILGITPSAWSI